MLDVLNLTAPLFTLIALGYLAVRCGILPAELLPGIARFVLYFCVPGVILSNFIGKRNTQIFEPEFIWIYASAALATLTIGFFVHYRIAGKPATDSHIYAMGGAMPNSMFVGFPILLQVTPDIAVEVLVMCLLVENTLVTPLAMLFADISRSGENSVSLSERLTEIAKRVVSNPMLIAILLGVTLSILDFYPPQFIQTSFDMLAQAAGAAALVFIGGSLVGNRIQGDLGTLLRIAAAKLILMPVLVMLLLGLTDALPPELSLALILVSAAPMFSIYPIIASHYGLARVTSGALLVTTLLSFFTVNGFLVLLLPG